MASIRKRNGKFQVQIKRVGITPVGKTFKSKRDAILQARGIEARIDIGDTNVVGATLVTLGDVLRRYRSEITPKKKGYKPEQRRLL